MFKNREVIDFLEDALNAMEKAELFVTDMTYEEFIKDELIETEEFHPLPGGGKPFSC